MRFLVGSRESVLHPIGQQGLVQSSEMEELPQFRFRSMVSHWSLVSDQEEEWALGTCDVVAVALTLGDRRNWMHRLATTVGG